MQKKEYSITDLCDIQRRMACGIDAFDAIQELMETGASTAESYLDALFGAFDYLQMLNKELAEAIEGLRAKKKAATI